MRCAKELSADTEIIACPLADGGEGTLEAVLQSGGFRPISVTVRNPLFEPITARYAMCGQTAFIEMAQASGLTLIPYRDGNAAITTTYGTGQLIADALQNGAKEIYVSVGGSATNDGGIGALAALGYCFLNKNGNELQPIGGNLEKIEKIDDTNSIWRSDIQLTVLADVNNPLVGEFGATRFYGRQKGAVGEIADRLEYGMCRFADVVEKEMGVKLRDMPFAGAAGGLSGGLIAFLGAVASSGIQSVMQMIDFEAKLRNADAVITGEGRLDRQSLCGKVISGVCDAAKKAGVPVYAIVGSSEITQSEANDCGIERIETLISEAASLQDAIEQAPLYMERAVKKLLNDMGI